MTFRSRKLLDLAHDVHFCMNCGASCPDGCEPAHVNGASEGKGFGHKTADYKHAALCHRCHAWYDQGTGDDPGESYSGSRDGKLEMWEHAHMRTLHYYFEQGWITCQK